MVLPTVYVGYSSAILVKIAHNAHINKIVSNTGNSLNTSNFDLTKPSPFLYISVGTATSLKY